ncbi:putative bifunctional diguanylate cyclase/phosphodiesterase [Shewanella algidipiscicola]|uniref:GGDEF-domain containing protein n=1 Tax=Shewanella algidipiscicola TaxID=614070 RepID=A0ABQ4P4B8_9GAMM|nr:bifunctional diguanylate cyclase/phosphodiesterase [Shewanella algidipiscicola]GIU42333.1 GGDEF-domain containing protein [Shewanella algidipiscicola]
MDVANLYWIMAYIIAIGVAGTLYWYWHRRTGLRFLRQLTSQLQQQDKVRKPLAIDAVPTDYIPLYLQLQRLLTQLPPPLGRDKLTGLFNRVGLKSRLSRLMPLNQGMFVLIDIHRFRYVNDLFGFSFGDQLLLAMSERIKQQLNDQDIVARMNEDEFLVVFKVPLSDDELKALQSHLQQPFSINDTVINLQVQLGYLDISLHYADVSQMLRRIDLALVRAKSSSGLIASYQAGDDTSQHRQLTIIRCFPKALAQNELYVVYQAKYNLVSENCSHVEALIRWESPLLGRVSPAEFIPLLERAGMITMLSQWVIKQVLHQQSLWRQSGMRLQVAVNLALDDLCARQLCQWIVTQLQQWQLSADVLAIEVTESQLMTDMQRTVNVLECLKRAGINAAIDDFGTGHSSLAYLKYLPVNEVKVDKAFLENVATDCRGQHILSSAVSLAQGLGFTVTVEGVETQTELMLLQQMGVDKIQGELFAKPMSAAELEMYWPELNRPIGEAS